MKVKCKHTLAKTFSGMDYKNVFDIGQEYSFFVRENYIWVYAKNIWRDVYLHDFIYMFEPVD